MIRMSLIFLFLVSSAFGEWKDLKKELKTLIKSNSFVAQEKLEECSQYDELEVADYLISLVKSKRTPVTYSMTACRVLGGYKNEDVRKLLAKEAKPTSSGLNLLQALTVQLDTHCESVCEEIILQSSDEKQLTIAIRTIGHFKEHKLPVLKKMLSKLDARTSTSVRRAVAEALGSVNSTEVAPYLINLMKDKLVAELAIDSIQRLTGQRLGNAPTSWRQWLAKNKEFKPVNQPLQEYLAEKIKLEEEKKAKAGDNDSAEFYGVEIKGENILFVLDRSGSMSAKTEYGSRLDQLKKEFTDMLDTIDYKKSLGVLWFPGNEAYPRSGVDEATDTFKDRLKKHIKGMTEGGGTPIGDAMTYTFEKIVEKRDIDAIYLLSDGAPNSPPEQVRQLIKNLNAGHFIKIHTISIGAPSEFLKSVASDNYGAYTEIK